ncbi:MAG: Fic family protein [Propionibacteriaceae bacterium]|jgi:Fic family protein|nr:Fic family protein [Propionibacteriaceae bacterium]
MNQIDEYAIDPRLFREALIEQRASRLKGGLYHLTQVQMAYNSNRIEGSRLTEEQTRYIYETHAVEGPALVDDIIETNNHFRLFDSMLDSVGQPLDSRRVKEYHRILKTGTADAAKDWFAVGDWKKVPNVVGGRETTPPDEVDAAMTRLLDTAPAPGSMTFDDICDFHHAFETIHPFQDGNGRVGRIILFQQCLAAGIMPFVILDNEKMFYYRGLSEYDSQPGFLRDTFRHFQDLYYAAFEKFVPRAEG